MIYKAKGFLTLFIVLVFSITTSFDVSAQTKKNFYPKTIVGRTYKGVVKMGEADQYVETTVIMKFKTATIMEVSYSMLPMGDKNLKNLLEKSHPGSTENKATFEYIYQKGRIKLKDSPDSLTLKKNGTILFWYESDQMNGNLTLQK